MKERFANKVPFLLILLITLLFANLQVNKRDTGKDICFNICGDARGYYAWLPAVFIYHDLNFSFFDSIETPDSVCGCKVAVPVQDYRYTFNGKMCNKYYPGAALMMLPFFAIAHVATICFTKYAPNGYSQLYFIIMGSSGIFYYFLGMLLLLKTLRKLQLGILPQTITILLITFGSNVIYYAIDAPLYSHIYSFTLVAALLYYSFCYRAQPTSRYIIYLSLLAGMILITRPVNISLFLLLPFIIGDQIKTTIQQLAHKPQYFLYFLPGLIMPLMLCILYKISTGNFFLYSYNKEYFDFSHPHFLQFLFHYNNGVFPYTPLLFMPFLLLFVWYKSEYKYLILGATVTLLVTIYIHCSWWAWDYGFSFGARTMLDFVPVYGIMIGISLKEVGRKYYYLLPVYILCCALTMILYHQKSHSGYMNHYPITDYWAAIRNALGIK